MKRLCKFGALVFGGLFLAVACSSSSPPSGSSGTGGMSGGTGGAGCEVHRYFDPGCSADVTPRCASGSGGACLTWACGCDGRIISGCGHEFEAPYAYTFASSYPTTDSGAMTCDPTSNPNP